MPQNVFVNEVRISLNNIRTLGVLRCQTSGISTGHKRRLEYLAAKTDYVALFEGDVLFCLDTETTDLQEASRKLVSFLDQHIRDFEPASVAIVRLEQLPQVTIERLVFGIISFRTTRNGIYTIYGRTLFKPTYAKDKKAHSAVETTIVTEDGYIKLYFTPTWIALTGINETYRAERHDLELISLCSHRVTCELANSKGTCPYIQPGRLGYYEKESPVQRLSDEQKKAFYKAYEGCPQISSVSKVIQVKAGKRALRALAYPNYTVFARLAKADLENDPRTAAAYRNATLMTSFDRWKATCRWISDILGDTKQLAVGKLVVPIEATLNESHLIGSTKTASDYKTILIPEQPIIINQQNPRTATQSGGWLFARDGAYDREDVSRPFQRVHPYLIVPGDPQFRIAIRRFFDILASGSYTSRTRGDQDFSGLNLPDSKRKYNCEFVNIWEQEEDIFLVDGTDSDYIRKALDIQREWNKSSSGNHDPNRIAIVIVPPVSEDTGEVTVYHRMKKIFMEEGIPSQFITADTLLGINNNTVAYGPILQSLWLNMYSKLGGKPWRLANQLENVHCFVGIGFGLNPRNVGNHIYAGVAHLFDRYGNWLDLASDTETLSAEDRDSFESTQRYLHGTSSFKISRDVTQNITYNALRLYQQYQTKTREPAKNIIFHKLGQVYECEMIGILEGIRQILGTLNECKIGILQIEQEHQVRLYGDQIENGGRENCTVYRGTGLIFNKSKMALATTGRVSRGNSPYPGIGTPTPLLLTSCVPTDDIRQQYGCNRSQFYPIESLARHTMALTQLHWGSTRDMIRLPITALYAHKVADLVSKTGANVSTWLSYHRPWFL